MRRAGSIALLLLLASVMACPFVTSGIPAEATGTGGATTGHPSASATGGATTTTATTGQGAGTSTSTTASGSMSTSTSHSSASSSGTSTSSSHSSASSASSSAASSAGASSASSSTGGPMCTMSCQACIGCEAFGSCGGADLGCAQDLVCLNYTKCVLQCTNHGCVVGCGQEPTSNNAYMAWKSCNCAPCTSECSLICP